MVQAIYDLPELTEEEKKEMIQAEYNIPITLTPYPTSGTLDPNFPSHPIPLLYTYTLAAKAITSPHSNPSCCCSVLYL